MVIIGWSLFYIVVLVLKSVTSLGHNRDLNYYDGSRGRMDRNYYSHDEFFQRNNRPKRTLRSPNLWAKSSESQGVSCPTRLRENSMDMLGDADRMKEVVHIPCPKRKSGGAKVVASSKGKSMTCNAEKSHEVNRGARELFKKNTRGNDLNHAVRQNAQWLIMSSQDQIQKPNQGYTGQNISSRKDQTGQNWNNMNQPLPNSYQGLPTLERPAMWRSPKGAKEEPRKTQHSKSAPYALTAASHLKPNFQAPQNRVNAPQISRLNDAVLLEKVGQQFSAASNQGYFNLGPPRNVQGQVPQAGPNQGPYKKNYKPLQNPYEANRLLTNSYNITYDGPHHYGLQNQPSNFNPLNPSGQLTYPNPNAQDQMNPSFLQSHVTPVNGIQYNTYTILYTVSVPSETPKVFQNTNETRSGPWAPGALDFDIPPGYPHQPKLPKTSTKSFDAVNIRDLPKADQKIPGQPSIPKYGIQGAQYQYQPSPNEKPQQESWRYRDGPFSYYQHQQNPNMARQEPPVSSCDKPGMTPSLEKTTQANKGVLGKFKKEESKVKLMKPAKIPASSAHARMPPMHAQGGAVSSRGGDTLSNAKLDEPARLLYQQELRPRLQNSVAENEAIHFYNEPKIPLRKTSQDRSMSLNDKRHQEHQNISGDMSHIINPPVTMDTSLYTNKAHKIASKFVSSEDVTYIPFRGVPPARNDEAFYDKNLNFLGKIDRPPLVNIKRHKWSKLNRRFNMDRTCKRFHHADYPVGSYSEPADFHSDMSAEDFGAEHKPKPVDHYSRKCDHNPRPKRQRFNTNRRA